MKEELEKNFNFIQYKIDEIINLNNYHTLDIKQISDLERYVKMQRDIVESILILLKGDGLL